MAEVETQNNLDFERKHEEDLRRIRDFRLMDDNFMSKVFEDKPCAEFLLRIILNRDDLKVKEVHGQHDLNNIQGRSVRLDILAVDYDALNETYVIFITENDVLRGRLPIYHINRIIEEMGKSFGDEAHIIYVNSQIKDDTALGKLMHDFTCTNPDDMNYPVLAQRVRYFKEDTKGVATMCRAFEEVREETKREQAIESAKTMLADGLPYEQIARYTKLSIEEVKVLDDKSLNNHNLA